MKAVRTGPEEIVVIHTNGPNGVVVEHFRRADVINLNKQALDEILELSEANPAPINDDSLREN